MENWGNRLCKIRENVQLQRNINCIQQTGSKHKTIILMKLAESIIAIYFVHLFTERKWEKNNKKKKDSNCFRNYDGNENTKQIECSMQPFTV